MARPLLRVLLVGSLIGGGLLMVKLITHALVMSKQGILILKRNLMEDGSANVAAGYWDIPGGLALAHELPQVAAKRECFEETGLNVELARIIWEDSTFDASKDEVYTRLVYQTRKLVPNQHVSLNGAEHSDFQWLLPSAILAEQKVVPYLVAILTKGLY